MKHEFINGIEKVNGNNRYYISICHTTNDEPEYNAHIKDNVKEYYRVHYCWKNAKRSMFNLTLRCTRTLEESKKLMEKKIKELEEKIK